MATIEEITDAMNNYIQNNDIEGFAFIKGLNIVVYLTGIVNRDTIELPIETFAEISTYTDNRDTNKIIYSYVEL